MRWGMQLLKDLLRNLAFLIVLVLGLLIAFPDIMKQIIQLYGLLFGPLLIFIVIVAAFPRRKRFK